MKRIIFTKVKFMALFLFAVLMAACTADVYEPKPELTPEPEKPGESLSGIPEDFDYSTIAEKNLTVNILDEYEGKYYYTIEVLDANPIMNEGANVLIGGKTNQNTPFEVDVVLPKALKEIFIRQIDPYGLKKIWSFEVKDGDMVCDLKPLEAPATKSFSQLRSGENFDSADGVSFDSNGAEVVYNIQDIKQNGTYLIPIGNTLIVHEKDLKGVKLYVEGTLKINDELSLKDKSEIYVAGSVIGKELDCEEGSRLFNSGSIDLNKIDMGSTKDGQDCVIFNTGTIKVDELDLDGTRVFNYCLIDVKEDIDLDGAASSIYINGGAILCKELEREKGDLNIYMKAKTMFVAEKVEMDQGWLTVYGEQTNLSTSDYPLFKTQEMKGNFRDFYKIEVSVKKGKFSFNGVSYGQPTTQIDKSSCNKNTGNEPEKDPEPDKDPDYQEKDTPSYTYMFEDNWPAFGDYDMNDIVMDVNIANTVDKNGNATSVTISTTLRAVGATKNLYAFAQIEASGANNQIVSLLSDQEAHAALGQEQGSTVNTFKYNCDSRTYTIDVPLSGVTGRINANNLNVFIVWGDPNSEKRNEIHLPNFKGTSQAAATGAKGYKYDGSLEGANPDYDNMMWGLMVYTDHFDSYPKETIVIGDAYPGFWEWAKSGGKAENVLDWYSNGISDKLYDGKAPEVKD